jgi:hypothetical protein
MAWSRVEARLSSKDEKSALLVNRQNIDRPYRRRKFDAVAARGVNEKAQATVVYDEGAEVTHRGSNL